MDYFNDHYPLYPPNPENVNLSESEASEKNEYAEKVRTRKRKRRINFDDFCLIHSDDLWYLWCMMEEYNVYTGLFNRMDYPLFCSVCYENTD